jgi:hypothetical protein
MHKRAVCALSELTVAGPNASDSLIDEAREAERISECSLAETTAESFISAGGAATGRWSTEEIEVTCVDAAHPISCPLQTNVFDPKN